MSNYAKIMPKFGKIFKLCRHNALSHGAQIMPNNGQNGIIMPRLATMTYVHSWRTRRRLCEFLQELLQKLVEAAAAEADSADFRKV